MPDEKEEERFWLLVSLQLSGEATAEEEAELAELLNAHPAWGLRKEVFANIWRGKSSAGVGTGDAFNRHLQRLSNHLAAPGAPLVPIRRKRMGLRIAASVLVALALVWLLVQNLRKPADQGYNTVSTRPGSRSKIQLPDGSLVWLNADSRLAYKSTGQTATREVQLTGEAYFEVARDPGRPFLIHTATIDIRVLGTAFNVQCYGNERTTETSLFTGSVEVTLRDSPDKKIVLKPSEKLIVHNNEMTVSGPSKLRPDQGDEPLMTLGKVHYQQKDSAYLENRWTRNQLAFDNTPLEEVALQIERWYGVHVTFTDERLKRMRYSGVFEDESLSQVMEALHLTGNFHYTIHKKEVIISL